MIRKYHFKNEIKSSMKGYPYFEIRFLTFRVTVHMLYFNICTDCQNPNKINIIELILLLCSPLQIEAQVTTGIATQPREKEHLCCLISTWKDMAQMHREKSKIGHLAPFNHY